MLKSTGELKEKFFKWTLGRQSNASHGNYYKMLVMRLTNLEVHLIKVPQGTMIKSHVDYVKNFEHHRVNITLWKPKHGGHFYCERQLHTDRRVFYFRPDMQVHGLTMVHVGRLYLLSVGWVKH